MPVLDLLGAIQIDEYTLLTGVFVAAALGWVGMRTFNYWRSRIICGGKPRIRTRLIKETTVGTEPQPVLQLEVSECQISARQRDGKYWLTGTLYLPNGESVELQTERLEYEYPMDLGGAHTLTKVLPDWSLWDDNAALMRKARVKVFVHVNDRKAKVVESQLDEVVVTPS